MLIERKTKVVRLFNDVLSDPKLKNLEFPVKSIFKVNVSPHVRNRSVKYTLILGVRKIGKVDTYRMYNTYIL